jgi:potassium-dependent mechanosensitive channel
MNIETETRPMSRSENLRAKFVEVMQGEHKWRFFFIVLFSIAVLGTAISWLTRITLIQDDAATRPTIAVVLPEGRIGQNIKQGIETYVNQVNQAGGYHGRLLQILAIPESAESVRSLLANPHLIGVVGYTRNELVAEAADKLAAKNIPIVTFAPMETARTGVVSINVDPGEQARFAGNYARNIVQQRLMYVIRQEGAAYDPLVEPFVDVYTRFDTPVRNVWSIRPDASADATLKEAIEAISELGVGAVYIATEPELAAKVITRIRASGNAVEFFGPAQLASQAFTEELERLSGKDAHLQSHGVITSTPVLFDTANEEAQRFQNLYQQQFNSTPDWVATVASDAVQLVVAIKDKKPAAAGRTGDLKVDDGVVTLPIQMGIYNGKELISAPIQLLPIAKGSGFNYIDALRQGRVLYVNDRFMYKSNVVYVGTAVHSISNFDIKDETVELDMSIWFRYRGDFSPQNLLIENGVSTITLDKPEKVSETDDMQYRRYRIKEKFHLNFTQRPRAFGQHIAGISFRHRDLNRNNLTYVVDVLGMPTGRELMVDLNNRDVIGKSMGWQIANAWISQEMQRERGEGEPQYVGMTGEAPLFSTISLGILLKPAVISARDVISAEYFIYLGIFGLLGAVFALVMDHRRLGHHWALQSWLLRLIFWPILLVSFGNLILDWSFANNPTSITRNLVLLYNSAWWILFAWLINLAIHRFIWATLEERAGRKIPNVMKILVTVLVYVLAIAGITAFVFNETLTSLLATSGVLAMVIGFAIQSNIANVFSGIILNIERPFKVGEYIKLNNLIGQVTDITWRTTRLEANDGQMISLANSKVSESLLENYSRTPHGITTVTDIYTHHEADPKVVLKIVNEAVAQAKAILFKEDPDSMYAPQVRYRGVANINGYWVAHFSAGYRVAILPKKGKAREQLWTYLRAQFLEQGIALAPIEGSAMPMVISEAGGAERPVKV